MTPENRIVTTYGARQVPELSDAFETFDPGGERRKIPGFVLSGDAPLQVLITSCGRHLPMAGNMQLLKETPFGLTWHQFLDLRPGDRVTLSSPWISPAEDVPAGYLAGLYLARKGQDEVLRIRDRTDGKDIVSRVREILDGVRPLWSYEMQEAGEVLTAVTGRLVTETVRRLSLKYPKDLWLLERETDAFIAQALAGLLDAVGMVEDPGLTVILAGLPLPDAPQAIQRLFSRRGIHVRIQDGFKIVVPKEEFPHLLDTIPLTRSDRLREILPLETEKIRTTQVAEILDTRDSCSFYTFSTRGDLVLLDVDGFSVRIPRS